MSKNQVSAGVKLPQTGTESIYVGYLPLTKGMNRFATLVSVICILWLSGMAGVIAIFMSDPGQGVWDTGTERQWVGKVQMTPYPMLISKDDTDATQAYLVVGVGKFGVHDRLKEFDGQMVQLTGWKLQRDGRSMIELGMDSGAISQMNAADGTSDADLLVPSEVAQTPFESMGEIVDGKCYLGAMKPGNGFGHRACAVLCIQGGLPPMFVYELDGQRTFAMLKVDGSTSLSNEVLGLVAQKVRLNGTSTSIAGLQMIEVSSGEIELQ